MIAPATMDALADVARALGFELRPSPLATPIGLDEDRAREQTQHAIFREGDVVFDGTARECAAFLIGWRDLRAQVLGAVRAIDARVLPEMSGRTTCQELDAAGRRCLLRAGHDGEKHATLAYWEDPPR